MIGRRRESLDEVELPGDYCYTENYTGGKPAVFFIRPNASPDDPHWPHGRIHHVVEPPHVFRHCDDGSIEIRESIACYEDSRSTCVWHGYLDEGHVWRTV
jgi:hypothetical protein